jgi:hypothetical protein
LLATLATAESTFAGFHEPNAKPAVKILVGAEDC